MKKRLNTFKMFDVVVVPFPFTEQQKSKNRPAVIISDSKKFNDKIGQSILAMITSAEHSEWPLDVPINSLVDAGLTKPSKIRFKLFTLDHTLIHATIGRLTPSDAKNLKQNLSKLFLS